MKPKPLTDPMLRGSGEVVSANPFREFLGASKRPDKLVPLPGDWGKRGFKTRLWVLSEAEVLEARTATVRFLSKHFGEGEVYLRIAADPAIAQEELERQVVARSLRDPDEPTQALLSVEDVRIYFTAEDRAAIMDALTQFRAERSPLASLKSPEDAKEFIALLGKDPTASELLNYSDIDTLRSIARELAVQLTTLMRANSSST